MMGIGTHWDGINGFYFYCIKSTLLTVLYSMALFYYYKIMVIVINTNLTYVTNRFLCIVIK